MKPPHASIIRSGVRRPTNAVGWLCFAFLLIGLNKLALSEGTRQLEPIGSPTNSYCRIALTIERDQNRIPFALIGCHVEYRLNIHIEDYNIEKIYMGFGNIIHYSLDSIYTDVKYQLKDPAGNIVPGFSLRPLPQNLSQDGYINTYGEASIGPDINNSNPGGYQPLEIIPYMNGDYVLEFEIPTRNALYRIFKYFDVTVAKGNTPVNGRLWSKAWQLSSGDVTAFKKGTYAKFFIYTSDSVVSRFDCNGLAGGVWTIYSNEWGCGTSGTWNENRRSIRGNTTVKPQHRIFLNDPDPLVYPSGNLGELIDFRALPFSCDTVMTFLANVSKAGNIEITVDSPPYNPGSVGQEDAQLVYKVSAGNNTLLPGWHGTNILGKHIPNGTNVKIQIRFLNGLSNIPLFDVEDNPKGFKVDFQRPLPLTGSANLRIYWDDILLPANFSPTSNTTVGCKYDGINPISGCHPWSYDTINSAGLGDYNTINSWWYQITNTAMEIPITLQFGTTKGEIIGPRDICRGQSASFLTYKIPYAQQYIWHISGENYSADYVKSAHDTLLSHYFAETLPPGDYSVSVYGKNQVCGDGEEISYFSYIHNPPEADFTYTYPCQSTGITFTDQSTPADAALNKFTWSVNSSSGDKRTFSGNPAVIVFDSLAGYSVSLIATDLLGCSDSAKKNITVKPKPESNFEYSENPDMKGELRLVNQTAGASSYFWDFGNSITSALAEPDIKYTIEGDYIIMLVASTPDGCHDTATREYYYAPGLWMPNAFTPDKDENNIFRPVTRRIRLDPYQLLIYNRWGQLVFQTTDASQGWDGTLNGEKCPTGNYTYYIQYRDSGKETIKTVTERGIVRLIR